MDILSGKKTLIVNVLTIAAVVLNGQFGFDAAWLHSPNAIAALAAVNVALRFVTNTPAWLVAK